MLTLAGAAIAAALAGAPSLAAAADWWVASEGVDGARTLSDAESRRCADNRCSIWERIIPSPGQDDAKVIDSLAEYDCATGRTATAAEATYGPGMKALGLVQASQLQWFPVDSGTVGRSTMLFACRADVGREPGGGEDSVEIEGQSFVREASPQPPPPSLAAGGLMASVEKAPSAPPVQAPPPAPPAPARRAPEGAAPKGGTHLAQIGAFDSRGIAQAAINTLEASDPQLLSGLETRVDNAVVDGRTFYRAVVAGFTSPEAAQAFCTAVRRADRPCLVRAVAKARKASQRP